MEANLKFSAPDWCFFPENTSPEDYYRQLKALGIDAVEMVPGDRRAAARSAGLDILNLGAPGMEAGLNNPANHAELIPGVKGAIHEAAEGDIPHVIIFSGNRVEGIDNGQENCVRAIEQLLPEAEKCGRVLIFEMLNSFEHVGYEADNSAYGFDLVRHFNSPHLKVLLDLYHMDRMGEDAAALIAPNIDQIAHLHVAGSPKRDFPGPDQAVDYAACLQQAAQAGYNGYWGMEYIPSDDRMEELKRAITLFRELAP